MTKGRPLFWATGPFFCLVLLSCGDPTAPSTEESWQLDNAEAMLNAAPDELSNIDTGELDADGRNAPAEP